MKLLVKLALAASLGVLSPGASAQEHKAGNLKIEHPWVRVTLPGGPAGGYTKVYNMGAHADKILSAASAMAERVELHTHIMKNGIMMMRRVKHVEVPAKGHVEFKSGGLHFMIFGLKHGLKKGDKLPMSIVFENAGTVNLEAEIKGVGKMKMKMKMDMKTKP
ncbi:MAG: copper chaperone PCu(A)C [Alphaproteobacteria bacterium]